MEDFLSFAQSKLEYLQQNNSLRRLKISDCNIDFTSNDYLGIGRSEKFNKRVGDWMASSPSMLGTGGSRLLSGNQPIHEQVEAEMAQFFRAPAALVFASGYLANLGLLSALLLRGDAVFYDALSHASIKDGIRLGLAEKVKFKHNDAQDLEAKLKRSKVKGKKIVVVEAIYSMDGDQAPLQELLAVCEANGASLIVDEAHSTGVLGEQGAGLVVQEQLEDRVLARVHTFGKAAGCHGGVVVGPSTLIHYLINHSRAFIYTTAPSAHQCMAISIATQIMEASVQERKQLLENIGYFKSQAAIVFQNQNRYKLLPSDTAIQGVVIPEVDLVKSKCMELQAKGIDVRPVLSPTVPKGSERIRICLHSFNIKSEIDALLLAFQNRQ